MTNSFSKELKDSLKTKFEKAYPNKRLLAVHLNGFSHTVIFDSNTKDSEIEAESYSAYAPEQARSEKVKQVLQGIPHYPYQNNAEEVLFIGKNQR